MHVSVTIATLWMVCACSAVLYRVHCGTFRIISQAWYHLYSSVPSQTLPGVYILTAWGDTAKGLREELVQTSPTTSGTT